MQRNQQMKIATWSTFSSTLPFFHSLNTLSSLTVFSKKSVYHSLTNKFVNLIMTNGEKEKAFKNLQTTLFYLNQKRIEKGKPVLDFKETEKRKSGKKEFVSGLPVTLHSVLLPLQLPTKSLEKGESKEKKRFIPKKKLSFHSLREVKFSLLSSIDTNLQSPFNQRKEREKVEKKEKQPFKQNSFSKKNMGESDKKTWFLGEQRLPSIQEEIQIQIQIPRFFNQDLSFKDLSSWVSFSPFLLYLSEGTQKENKIENKKERVLLSPLLLGEENGKTRSTLDLKQPFPFFVFCFSGLPSFCLSFKKGKPLSFQSSIKTNPLTQKQTILQKDGFFFRKVRKRNQKPKDNNPILTSPKEGKIEENKYPFHLRVLYKGISQVRPLIEVRKVRKGGNTFQVPAFVKKGKGEKMGLSWLIQKNREKSFKSTLSFSESLSSTLLQSFEKSGEARQKRDQLLRLALSNRPYSRFRWW